MSASYTKTVTDLKKKKKNLFAVAKANIHWNMYPHTQVIPLNRYIDFIHVGLHTCRPHSSPARKWLTEGVFFLFSFLLNKLVSPVCGHKMHSQETSLQTSDGCHEII